MTVGPKTIRVAAAGSGKPLGFVVIDSTVNGRARGGLRMLPDVSEYELEKLARSMTLKYGFLGLAQGGAKGGVLGNPECSAKERAELLKRFAMAARPVLEKREYVPDADMGTTGTEIQQMLEGIGVRVAPREHRGTRSGDYTAGTVYEGAQAAAAVQGMKVAGSRVAIEGFGKVGGPLAEMFERSGARVVSISTRSGGLYQENGLDISALRRLARRAGNSVVEEFKGADRIGVEQVKSVPADIYCPCARHDSVRVENVDQVPARIISCGANHPVTREAELLLWERGTVCLPDYVANSGGVLGGTMEFAGWDKNEILHFLRERFRPRVAGLIRGARQSGRSLPAYAEAAAKERFDEVRRQAEKPSPAARCFSGLIGLYREGWLPGSVIRRLSEAYFAQRVRG